MSSKVRPEGIPRAVIASAVTVMRLFRESASPPPRPAIDPATAVAPARRLTDATEAAGTRIGSGFRIRGELTGGDAVDLAGTLEGNCSISAPCRVREGGRLVGDVSASSIVIEGEVSGRALVAERIEIGAAARVRARVRAKLVAIAEGAVFDGQVHMKGRRGAGGAMAFQEKRKGRG